MADYISQFTGSEIDQRLAKVPQVEAALAGKQATLVSGTNIKTINGQSVLGSGDMTIQAGDTDAVKYVAQTLTDAQKAQARTNIDAASLADIADFDFVTVTSLPTASASTMGHIYLVGPDANDNYDRYYTQQSGSTYSWVALGSTEIDLSGYATQAELNQLEAEVHNLSGKYYGLFETSADLPEGDATGYAFVGESQPFAIWNFDGEEWADSGAEVDGIQGEPGVGLDDVESPSPADGTVEFTLSNRDTITLDLNHNHPQYTKVYVCADQTEYDDITTKDSMTFYVIPEVALYLGDTLLLQQGGNLPYTPVSWIGTDGTAYINTGIKGNAPMSAYVKVTPVPPASANTYYLGCRKDSGATRFIMLTISSAKACGFTYGSGAWGGVIDIANSVDNQSAMDVKVSYGTTAQKLSVKQAGQSSYTDYSGNVSETIITDRNIYLFGYNNAGTAVVAQSGNKCHGLKIYSDATFTTLVFDGVPCYYNGEYGLWDKVGNSFHGNAAGSGSITGPSI